MKSLTRIIIICLMGLAWIVKPTYAANTHPLTGEKLADEQTFTYNLGAEPPSIDPQVIEDVGGSTIARDLFEGLLVQDAQGNLQPGVAERWESNNSRDVYTFYLRKNARWSNGDVVTASDFVYAWRRLVDPDLASPYAGYMQLMSVKNAAAITNANKPPSDLGVTALDEFTFQVTLEHPLSYFTVMVAHASTFPVPEKVVETLGPDWTKAGNMVSNGAYQLQQHVINERLVRVRNPYYWNNEKTIIDKVVALVINDESQAFNRYQANELDKINVPSGQFKRLKKQRPDEVHANPSLCSYYYLFNADKPPFNDKRVRQALSFAIDRKIITKNILGAGQIPAYTFVPGATANFDIPKVSYAKMTQAERITTAKKLLAEAGFGPSNPLQTSILYNTSEGHKKIAIVISQMWKQHLGVKVILENQEWKTFISSRDQGDYQVARGGWCADYNEASSFLNIMHSDSDQNDVNFNNPEVDRLLNDAKSKTYAYPYYHKIEQILATEFPIATIYHYTSSLLLKPYVQGWPHNNVEENWYSRNLYITAH